MEMHRATSRNPITGTFSTKESTPEGKLSIKYKGKTYKRYKAGSAPKDRGISKDEWACDCGADYGSYHDLGCDCEHCPICREYLISCGHEALFKDGKKQKGFGKEVVGTLKDVGSDFLVGLKKGFTPPGWKS